jgi:hypothetical protein
MGMRTIPVPQKSSKETVMNIKSKIAASLAVVTLATALMVPTTAHAGKYGWGIAAGVVGGAIVAGAIANSYAEPVYGGYYDGYRRCRWERQYNAYGDYVGNARVCRVY